MKRYREVCMNRAKRLGLKKVFFLTGVLCSSGSYILLNLLLMEKHDVLCSDDKKELCSSDVAGNVRDGAWRTSSMDKDKITLRTSETRKKSNFSTVNVEQRSKLRCAYMRSQCDHFYHAREYDPKVDGKGLWALRSLMSYSYSSDEHNFTIFTVMKVGSWHWKKVMEDLNQTSSPPAPEFQRPNPEHLTILRAAKESLYLDRLKSHYKIIFVRHPLARAVSAWRDKFVDHHSPWYRTWAVRMIRMFRKNTTSADFRLPTPTILEFVRYITESGDNDEHWRPVWQFYQPCRIHFDFIGRLETVLEDLEFLFNKLGIRDKVTYHPRNTTRPTTDLELVQTTLANIPQNIFQRLLQKYENDFRLFGYHIPANVSDIKLWAELYNETQ